MSETSPAVTLLGTGTMGAGMARSMAAAGLRTRAWNRTPQRAAPLAEAGVTVVTDLDEAMRGTDVLVTMLFDAEAVEQCLANAGDALAPGALWIQTTTVGITATARFAQLAERRGLLFVDAPVLGTKGPAESGNLVVLASGPDDAHDRCAPVLDAVGSRTIWVGPAGAGSRLKLAVNAWVLTVVQGIGESLALTRELGLDPALFVEAVRGGAVDAPYVGVKGASMMAGDFTPAFALRAAAKDAALVLDAARSVGLDLALASAVAGQLDAGVAARRGDLDMSALYLGLQARDAPANHAD